MTELRHCPGCGLLLTPDAPSGLCPKCLLREGLKEPEPTVLVSFQPPTVEEMRQHFPQLEILGLLGRGGMGAVYKARQISLDRLVAIKILPPEFGRDPQFVERFTREARALARLAHPQIVSVYDFGQTNGLLYIIMEYVNGTTLRHLMQSHKLSPAEALVIIPQLCEALQYAHNEGVIHRDIKPENILIDQKGMVKIADFGLAKLVVGDRDAFENNLTQSRQILGTPRYMAPEQLLGGKEVDHRSDIYALGVVFYEMLTGEVPVGRFEPPSERVQIDVRIDSIVLRALERNVERRYQHASQMKTDVEVVVAASDPVQQHDTRPLGIPPIPVPQSGRAEFQHQPSHSVAPAWKLRSRWWRVALALLVFALGWCLWKAPAYCRSRLMLAAERGDMAGVLFWGNLGLSTETTDDSEMTPLLWAAWNGDTEIVRMLLTRGANLEQTGRKGETALMKAAYHGHTDIVQLLRERGARLDRADDDGQTALIRAAGLQHPSTVEVLIQPGSTPAAACDLTDINGFTALTFASIAGHDAIVKQLLKQGADPNVQSKRGLTPLMLAAFNRRANVVRTLLPVSDVNAKGHRGETALRLAVEVGDESIVDLLLGGGAVESGPVWLWRGYRLGLKKQFAAAIPLLKNAVAAAGDAGGSWRFVVDEWKYDVPSPESLTLLLLAECYQRAGSSEDAAATLQSVLKSLPKDNVTLFRKTRTGNGTTESQEYSLTSNVVQSRLKNPQAGWALGRQEMTSHVTGSSSGNWGRQTVESLFQ
ncbi:MAG: ankyrin repeat domain-containing protein [Planctomycetaceae bacterium]